ncbi:hypothetical protein DYQ86_20640 [Acidobacteria bacterium AB60]|nr:hypothetical protein DYQ86_20640 [Acidobacteria bacterium AB60]
MTGQTNRILLSSAGLIAVITGWILTVSGCHKGEGNTLTNRVHITLIGASIGEAWHLAEWPSRVQAHEYTADSLAAWQFDKSEAVEETLIRPKRKVELTRSYLKSLFQSPPTNPNIVILKECSSYFPGDMEDYKQRVRDWVRQLQAGNIQVMLATVVPVTQARAASAPGKQESLLAYNQWIREFAHQQHIPVLDLEAALREPGQGSYLRLEYAADDGSHLNDGAYRALDIALWTTLCQLRPNSVCEAAATHS